MDGVTEFEGYFGLGCEWSYSDLVILAFYGIDWGFYGLITGICYLYV